MAMSFVKVYFDFEDRTEMLNEVEQGRLLLAMLRYAQGKELPELKGGERFLFPVFKIDIDRDANAYASKCENGAKGGRPSGTDNNRMKPNETEENLNKPNETEDKLICKNKNKNKNKEQEQDNTLSADAEVRDGFENFWAEYPRKVSKQAAFKAWKGAKIRGDLVNRIIDDVHKRISTEWKGADMQFIPHPATYINQRRWEDETPPTERKEGGSKVITPENNPALNYAQRDWSELNTDDFFVDLSNYS